MAFLSLTITILTIDLKHAGPTDSSGCHYHNGIRHCHW
ncbi:YHYH domain-containing protein [Photobacterium rosenbergii]|uniref:YHYH domain-containing protein n=1 Tax=Photobacterium rosenbergii TaxID=294936 RepID=A0A2T3N9Z1_9GAMM|nr:YHYH domain-containing protein [Photobacterium rosenbergii]